MHKNHPLFLSNYLKNYAESGTLRAHMPGHKGCAPEMLPENLYSWDITEITGADSLFEAEGILRQSEERTAAVWGSPACCWSAGGSTLCIQAMLARMKAQGRVVVAARTVHRAFLNACILLGLEVQWVFPRSGGIVSGEYALEDFADALDALGSRAACIYVTSPDYLGNMQDIAGLAAICHARNARLLVDNAHGAHLSFLPENRHPMALGADYCCDSAHKLLPALTGAAILHSRHPEEIRLLKSDMQLFGSTSPSYLIMQSLESCTAYMEERGHAAVAVCAERADALRRQFLGKFRFIGEEPLHLTIAANAHALGAQLRRLGVECEYADASHLVLLLSPVMTAEEFAQLADALERCTPEKPCPVPTLPAPMRKACDMRTAALSDWELVKLSEARGRVCAPVQVPCPPAVPIAVSGEELSGEWLALMGEYGLKEIAVMR